MVYNIDMVIHLCERKMEIHLPNVQESPPKSNLYSRILKSRSTQQSYLQNYPVKNVFTHILKVSSKYARIRVKFG